MHITKFVGDQWELYGRLFEYACIGVLKLSLKHPDTRHFILKKGPLTRYEKTICVHQFLKLPW